MKLKLTRKTYTTRSTIGDLEINGKFQCFVLEDPVRPVKIDANTAIPAGSYPVTISHSPKFQRLMPLLEHVPNYEGVRIHWGNKPEDTEGCLLVGSSKATDFIGSSRDTFNVLYAILEKEINGGGSVTIEIIEGGVSPFMAGATPMQAAASGALFRVTADPLRLRSTPDSTLTDNILGRLDFGTNVTATGGATAAGWVEVDAVVDGQVKRGLVSSSFVEPLPANTANVMKASAAATRAKTMATAPEIDDNKLFRVKSDSLNLRTEAGLLTDEAIIASLPRDQLVRKIRASNSKALWWEVETIVHGVSQTGFVNSAFLTSSSNAVPSALPSTQPVATVPPGEVQLTERPMQMILDFEGMDQPSAWPGQSSGISLGHGYDLGYHTFDEFRGDWGPHLESKKIQGLSTAIGKRGTAAANIASNFADIRIMKAAADAVFATSTVPKIKLWALKTFPGILALPADAQGALVSLVYNRGTDLEKDPKDKQDRRREMRDIRDTLADGSLSVADQQKRVAASIRSMNRLWPSDDKKSGHPGIRRRREAEAAMVENAV